MSGGAAYLEPSSLMDEMMAVFAPPGRGDSLLEKRSHVELHPYYKRPGKGHNHDSCDACGEGGDLICCDNCPASFHFACHAPPLEEEDIPLGDWICLRCYHREQLRLVTANANLTMNMVGVNSKQQKEGKLIGELMVKEDSTFTATDLLEDVNQLEEVTDDGGPTPGSSVSGGQGTPTTRSDSRKNRGRHNRPGPASKKNKDQKAAAAEKEDKHKNVQKIYRLKYEKYLRVKTATNSPFDLLVAATQVTNADQFKLPSEMEVHEMLPFSWKWSEEIRDAELLNGGNGDSQRCCTACFRTCRAVPSVGCDFCSSIYHLDCLDPPLCEVPRQERWMCPNHVENFIDSNLVTSTSLTERLKLWNKYGGSKSGPGNNFNPDTIKLEFFRRVRKGKLYERGVNRTRVVSQDKRIRVPQYIKDHYRNPIKGLSVEEGIPQLPKLNETTQSMSNGTEGSPSADSRSDGKDQKEVLKQEHDEWLAQLVGLQIGLLKRQMLDSNSENKSTTSDENIEGKKLDNETSRKSRKTKVTLERREALRNKKFRKKPLAKTSHGKLDILENKRMPNCNEEISINTQSSLNSNEIVKVEETDEAVTKSNHSGSESTKPCNEGRSEGRMEDKIDKSDKTTENDDTYSTCSSTASECSFGDLVDDTESDERKQVISSDARSEIYEYLARLRKSKDSKGYNINQFDPVLKDFLAIQRIDELFSKESRQNGEATHSSTSSPHIVQSRAALVPLNNPRCREPCNIQRRSVEIGLGVSCGIDLSKVGHCNFISSKHATIFFDQYSRVYELINYSEHGTIVDNIIYTLNPVTGHGDTKLGSHFQSQPSSSNTHGYSINNNTGDHHSDKIATALGKKGSSAASKIIADNYKPSITGSKLKTMSSNVHQFNPNEKEWRPCNCSDSIQRTMNVLNDEMRGGCENSALLHHGSYIRFGCLQFVFTIVDYTNNDFPRFNNSEKQEELEETKNIKNFNNVQPRDDKMLAKKNDSDEVENTETSAAVSECEESNQASDSMEIDP